MQCTESAIVFYQFCPSVCLSVQCQYSVSKRMDISSHFCEVWLGASFSFFEPYLRSAIQRNPLSAGVKRTRAGTILQIHEIISFCVEYIIWRDRSAFVFITYYSQMPRLLWAHYAGSSERRLIGVQKQTDVVVIYLSITYFQWCYQCLGPWPRSRRRTWYPRPRTWCPRPRIHVKPNRQQQRYKSKATCDYISKSTEPEYQNTLHFRRHCQKLSLS